MPCSLPRWSGSIHYGYVSGAFPRRAFPIRSAFPTILLGRKQPQLRARPPGGTGHLGRLREDLLRDLKPQELRDLFAYLESR